MTLDNTTLAILLVIAMAGREIVILAVRKWWTKTVDTEYVTVATCSKLRDECKHGGEVTEAMNRMASELKVLRTITVRHMLNNNGQLTADDRKNLEALLNA